MRSRIFLGFLWLGNALLICEIQTYEALKFQFFQPNVVSQKISNMIFANPRLDVKYLQ